MDDITADNYRKNVEDLAREALVQHKERPDDDLSDIIHELADGSEWVIYTYRAHHVVIFSDNANYGIDEGLVELSPGSVRDVSDLITQLAFWALRADVQEAADELQKEAEAEAE
jgi:hypothetical protein